MTTKEKLKAMLEGAAGAPAGVGGVLAHHFRKALITHKIDEQKWDELMTRFVNFELKDMEQNGLRDAQAASLRANLTKELTQPIISWKVFVKGMRFLGYTTLEFGTRGSGDDFVDNGSTTILTMNSMTLKEGDDE